VILQLSSAVTARRDRHSQFVDRARLALCVVENSVVSWIKASPAWIGVFHRQGDPVSECHTELCVEHVSYRDEPLWDVVDEDRATRLEDSDRLREPHLGPS